MKYALKKIRSIRIYDIATNEHKVTFNDLKNFQLTGGQETVYAEGADGAKLAAFDLKKVAALKASNGAIDVGYIALQTGSENKIVVNGTGIKIREEIVVTDPTSVELSKKATGVLGNEIGFIYKADSSGQPDQKYTQGTTVSTTVFTYTPPTTGVNPTAGKITLPTNVFKAGDVVFVDYYPAFTEYKEMNNDSNKFAMSCEVIVDAWFTDLCTDLDVPLQLVLPKGKISGNIDMSFGDAAAVQNIEIEALTSACASSDSSLWKLFTYDMEKVQ